MMDVSAGLTPQQQVLAAFDSHLNTQGPTLSKVLESILFFAQVDDKAGEIVLDTRSVMLAVLDVGWRDPEAGAAAWFARWFQSKRRDSRSRLGSLRTRDDILEAAFATRYRLILSSSVLPALSIAQDYARRTVSRPRGNLRHFLAALTSDKGKNDGVPFAWAFAREFNVRLTERDVDDWKRRFLKSLESWLDPGEDLNAWREILDETRDVRPMSPPAPPSPPPQTEAPPPGTPPPVIPPPLSSTPSAPAPSTLPDPPPPVPAIEAISGFFADRPNVSGGDALDRAADIQAFARLICLEEATPPLSIGVFGGWGSGKSTFMEALEAEVEGLTRDQSQRQAAADAPRFISRVVQMRFNAWHFQDANLWASLTSEFFDQLRVGGYGRLGDDVHRRLVEKVNAHVHQLSDAALATREALLEGEHELAKAQRARDDAVAMVERAPTETLSQTLVDKVSAAYERHKDDIKALKAPNAPSDPASDIDSFVGIAKDLQTLVGQIKTLLRFAVARPWRRAALIVAGLICAAIIAQDSWTIIPLQGARDTLVNVAAWFSALLAAGSAIWPALRTVSALAETAAGFSENIEEVQKQRLRELVITEATLKAASEEATARRRAADRAAQALSRYVDPRGRANPPRLLRYMLEDDPETKALEREIGLVSRAHRLFHAVNQIVLEERKRPIEERDAPERIVLYIDDLDRCSYPQVYAVLQAIHLLLAFELFVVVVGVDVKWVQEALANEMGVSRASSDTLGTIDPEHERRTRAIDYLEKIFQLPFWLRPLSVNHNEDTYGAYVRDLLGTNEVSPEAIPTEAAQGDVRQDIEAQDVQTGAAPAELKVTTDAESSFAALDNALATVRLTPEEQAFLASPEIGALASPTPRGVKRLVNVYRIVRARLADADMQDDQTFAHIGPLIAIAAALETGPSTDRADAFYTWIKKTDGGTSLRAQNFSAITDGLLIKSAFDAAHGQRKGDMITSGEYLRIARIVRRYSFNRYH